MLKTGGVGLKQIVSLCFGFETAAGRLLSQNYSYNLFETAEAVNFRRNVSWQNNEE